MSLFETTRELVKRGCPEHRRLKHTMDGWAHIWVLEGDSGELLELAGDSDARDLWACHALRWFNSIADRNYDVTYNVDDVLALIEIHTRHLAATANRSPGGGE